eukprot:g13.t1
MTFPLTLYSASRPSYVLGIESSCDDTGVAIVDSSGEIISEALSSQTEIHAHWGGVVPRLAQEAHNAVIDKLVASVLESVDSDSLSAVAVTIGPGLSLCLRVGVEKALHLSSTLAIPLIPIHHMEAHALLGRMGNQVEFPFLCLLVSGGHNLLLVVHGIGLYTQIGTTLDDSLGEAYDKAARMLELDLVPSGGAALEELAKQGNPEQFSFKTPMQKYNNCDFSYSGLKTSLRMTIEQQFKNQTISKQQKADLAASFQKVAIDHLCDKVARGIDWAKANVKDLGTAFVLSGGVAANSYVRARLKSTTDLSRLELISPAPRLCTDNGVMVAWTGMERLRRGLFNPTPMATPVEDQWLDLRARWPLTDRRAFPVTSTRVPKRRRLHKSLTHLTEAQLSELTTLVTEMPEFHVEHKRNSMSI